MQNDPYTAIAQRETYFDVFYLAGQYEKAVETMLG